MQCQRLEAELDAAHEQRQRDSYAGKPAPWELPMTGNQYDHECLAHFRAQRQLKSEQEAALAAVMSQLEIERVAQVSVEACAARYAESLGRCQRLEAELDAAHEQRQRDSYAGKPAPWELPMTGNQYDHECLAHFRAQRQLKSEQKAALAAKS
ncbi:hypothetical protein DIPPA_00025 [Diplonema papillatum]|nr:hypothetical protein DIPPA_00025 [Diplonema papillatum]